MTQDYRVIYKTYTTESEAKSALKKIADKVLGARIVYSNDSLSYVIELDSCMSYTEACKKVKYYKTQGVLTALQKIKIS